MYFPLRLQYKFNCFLLKLLSVASFLLVICNPSNEPQLSSTSSKRVRNVKSKNVMALVVVELAI